MKRVVEIDIRTNKKRYADTTHEAYITCRTEGMLSDGAIFYPDLTEEEVKCLAKLFVEDFNESPEGWWETRLEVCEPVGPTNEMIKQAHPKWKPGKCSRWYVKVVEPYTD